VMAGLDELDSTTIDRQSSYVDLSSELKDKKVGLIKEQMGEGVQPGVEQAIQAAADKLKAAGAEIVEVSLPSIPLALAVYYIICPAEVSSNMMRYDGQRYGYTYKDAQNLDDSYMGSRGR